MAKLTLVDAEATAIRSRPWTIRLECAPCYWYATGRALHEQVEVGTGVLGQPSTQTLMDWPALRLQVTDKLAQGYAWENTPYVRMSPASIAILTGVSIPTHVPVKPIKPAPIAMPSPIVPPVTNTQGVVTLKLSRDGAKVLGYKGLDATGQPLCDFDPITGLDFARQHNLDILFS